MKGSCPCGGVTVTLRHAPESLNSCNCSACFRLGTLWGYFDPEDVTVEGETRPFTRSDLGEPWIDFNFCPSCGTTISWTARRDLGAPRMGVNMRLFGPDQLFGIPVRFSDNANWDGEGERPPPRHTPVPFAHDAPF